MRATVQTFREHDRERTRPVWARNMVRRFSVAASSAVKWALDGLRDHEGNVERQNAEVFSGIGFYSRPAAGHRAEAVVVKVGGAGGHSVIVGTRSQDALKAIEAAGGALAEDEVVIFNSTSQVRVKANGEIHIGVAGGTVGALATKADLDALRAAIQGTTISPGDGGAALRAAILAASWTAGTTKLKAQ